MKKNLKILVALLIGGISFGQVGVNNTSPNVTLEVTAKQTDGSTSEGIIAPRLTGDALHQAELSSKYGELQDGTIAYVTAAPSAANRVGQTISIDAKGYYYYDSTPNKWLKFRCGCSDDLGTVTSLDCAGATITGSLTSGTEASGVSASVPYTGGNSGSYSAQSVSSTGVTGLTATLPAGTLTSSTGNIVYTITGTPSAAGTASFAISLGGQSCTLSITVGGGGPVITGLDCNGATITGTLTSGTEASGVSASVSYTGGNGQGYPSQTVTSTGVTGLTATRSAGTLTSSTGNIVYTITGTPSAAGTASFAISLGGQSCTLSITVGGGDPVITNLDCNGATITGTLTSGTEAFGVTAFVDYTGGNGQGYPSQTLTSTGVTGLTATLPAGILSDGSGGFIRYIITGTPNGAGTASFAISLGGQSCTLNIPVGGGGPVITGLDCNGATITGSLTSGLSASVTASVPYTGGNGQGYPSQTVNSTGVTGLMATLPAGTLVNGPGNIVYTITGTPAATGTASFAISLGGQSCTLNITVGAALPTGSGSLAGKTCFDVVETNDGGDCGTLVSRASQKANFSQTATNTQTYTFTPTSAVSNVRFYYANTNGQVINTISGGNPGTNITGAVNATVNYNTALNALASGKTRDQALTANIIVVYNNSATGTGTDVQLTLTVNVQDCACCGAYIAPGVYKNFMCHNLGADITVDPFTPSAAIHGAKYQWGAQTGEAGRYYSQANDQTNAGIISGWNFTALPNGTWLDASKTVNDPCPAGYRVPTKLQWAGVSANNDKTNIGTFVDSPTNYGSAIKLGNGLLLPTAGFRSPTYGPLGGRGNLGRYWSSTQADPSAYYLAFNSSSVVGVFTDNSRTLGFSIRCISE